MQGDDICACCGCEDGTVVDDFVNRLSRIHIMSKFVTPATEPTEITLCTICKSRMPFDIGELVRQINQHVDARAADDSLLQAFMEEYLTHVWPDDRPPTMQQLCNVLNGIRLYSPTGVKWEYHNLNQRLGKLGIDKGMIIARRIKRTTRERMIALIQRSTEWTLRQFDMPSEEEVPVTSVTPSVEQHEQRKAPDSVTWAPPVLSLPLDMPGVDRQRL